MDTAKISRVKVNSQEELISVQVNHEKFAKRKKVKWCNSKRKTDSEKGKNMIQ